MRLLVVFLSASLSSWAAAQSAAAGAPTATGAATANNVSMPSSPVLPELDRLQASATQTAAVIGRMRIEKWKADAESKRQAETNAQSIERNLTSALPGMIAGVRANPQDVAAQFKLYRNLNALYDVMSSLTESAGAFGPKNDYDALVNQLSEFDNWRRKVGDSVENSATATQSELEQLRNQVRTLQQAAVAAPPPKKVVVDDTEPAKKSTATTHKKKTASKPSTSDASSSSSSDSGTSPK